MYSSNEDLLSSAVSNDLLDNLSKAISQKSGSSSSLGLSEFSTHSNIFSLDEGPVVANDKLLDTTNYHDLDTVDTRLSQFNKFMGLDIKPKELLNFGHKNPSNELSIKNIKRFQEQYNSSSS